MAKGATSKSKTKNEENRKREEEQQKQQTTQRRADSKPQRTQTAETKPTTQEAAPKPTSTQIPTLEPKYASPEQIQEARDFGRRSLEMARAGQLDMSEKIPFTQGVEGYAEQYRIPKLEDNQANYDTSSDVYRAPAGGDFSSRPANAPYADKTWLKMRRGNAQEGAAPILGSRRGYAEAPVEENYDPSRLSARDQRRLRAIDNDIERLSGRYNGVEDQRRLAGLQAERDRITGQSLMSDDTEMSDLLATWLDNDYKMSNTEIEQAKQIIRDYENTEYKNSNIYDLTDEESAKLSQINALRDKISKPEAAVYGTMNATPGVSALMAAGDNDFYGWSLDQLRDEVARQRDIPMSAETRDYVNQLQQRIASYQDLMQNPNTVYSTGDVGVDDISGANTTFKNSAEVQRAINETETQMYKLMLESMRGEQPDYDKYSFRKANAQKQNPLEYNAADLITRGIESVALQNAMGSNGLYADIATDMLTDTGAEYIANKAGGMSNVEASNRAFGSGIGNIGLDVGINAAPGIINGIVERRLQRLRDQIPTIEDDVIEAALRQTDEVPTVEAPTQAARQAEPEVPTVEAPAQPAEQAAETAVRQAPTRQHSTNPDDYRLEVSHDRKGRERYYIVERVGNDTYQAVTGQRYKTKEDAQAVLDDFINGIKQVDELKSPSASAVTSAQTPIVPEEVNPDNVVYHSGTLSRNNKAETRGMMHDGMRNTGYYGTGHYFVDAAHKGELDNFKNYNRKPYSSVDISKYNNLYRADTDAKASELHSFSEDFMRYVNRYNDSKYYTDADGNIDPVAKAEYIDDLYDKFRRLFPEQDVSRGSFEDILDSYRNSHVDVDLDDLGDSEFTQFMKSMGYNGVDTRGTRSADTSRGVVIYDLDEDSILQSNVTDAEVKRGSMNRRVRNEGESVFDAAEDERIQKKLDAQRRDAEIDEEYHRIYDTSQLDEARSRIDALEKELASTENSAEYSRRILEDEAFLDEEVKRSVRELSQFDIEVSPEAEKALRIETATQDVEEANAAINDIRRQLNEAQASYDEQEALSFDAYEQARRNIEGVENTTTTSPTSVEDHYKAENARIDEFMNKTRSGSIEMENGQIIERYSLKDMKSQIREFKQNGSVPADTTIAVRYNDGSIKVYGEGDDLSDLKLNNVSGIIYDNGSTSAFAGRGVKVNNYSELYNDWGEDDWRLDFTDANDVPASNAPLTGEVEIPTVAEEAADDSVNVHDYGTGERKVESHRANTMNKSQYTTEENSPTENYEYNVWSREAQTEMGHQRWDDDPNAIGELANKEYWDAADARFAHDKWTELMEKGDPESIRQAGRLSRKRSYEMREGGRLIQANDVEADSVADQFNQARQLINKAVDAHRGAGTSEALDNFIIQLENRLQKEGLLDFDLQFFGEGKERRIRIIQEMLDEGMGAYAPTNKNIGSRDFSGVNKILSQLESGKIKDMDSLTKAIYRQNGGANISAENQKKIFDYLTEASTLQEGTREQEVLLAKAARLAMQDVPVSLGKKIRSILYTNMLGNFKTAVSRNALGNAAYNLLEQTRHPVAAGIDALTSLATKKRTTLGWNLDKFKAYGRGFAKGASDQAQDIAQRVNTGRNGSMGWVNALKENSTIWRENTDNKVRNGIGKLANNATFYVTNAMEMGDRPFFEANFEQRRVELQQLLERYGKQGVAGFDKIPDEAIDDTINMMAAIHAADAVFQKQGRMSMGLSKMREGLADMSRGAIGVDLLSTSATPFTMTPGNMLEKAIEYSPIGIAKNTAETISELSRGQFNQRRFVDEASRNLMSIPMLAGAVAAAKKGFINGGYSDDPDEKNAQISDDFIEYGLNIGDKTYNTADIPVLASILQTAGAINEKGLNADSLKQAAEAILLGSTMQGFRKLFGADTSYNSSLSDSFVNTVASAGNQLIPSLVRQTAQTTDEYKRDLGEYGTSEYYLHNIMNSIPGLRETLPVKYDTEGKPVLQNQGRNIGSKIAENYVLPMQVSEYDPSELNQEAQRLKDATDNAAGFVPYAKRSDLRDWDASLETPIEYTEEQFYDYKRDLGKLNSDTATRVIRSELYHSLSDEDKVSALADVYSAMKQVAKYNATGIETDDKLANAYMGEDGIDGFMERLEAKYNQYGLDPDVYIEMKTNGEDMTPFEGYKEAQEAVGIGDSASARKFWLDGQATGQGPESLQDYKDYSDALKEYDMSASDKAWAAFEANGADGIANLKEQRDTAFDTGFVTSDGKVNTQAYEKAVSVLGDNPDVLDGYTSFKSDITEKGYTTQEQYIPYVQNLPGLSNEQKGQYIMLYSGKTPTEDSLGKNAWAAYDSAGYDGYYLYKSLQEVKDYNGDDKRNKYDRIQQLYDWGYDQTTDMYQLLVDLKY